MAGNLPDRVSISDSDAPWNQSHPDPSDINVECIDCDWRGTVADADYDGVPTCPECGQDVRPRDKKT
jgi:hypothetical protein